MQVFSVNSTIDSDDRIHSQTHILGVNDFLCGGASGTLVTPTCDTRCISLRVFVFPGNGNLDPFDGDEYKCTWK